MSNQFHTPSREERQAERAQRQAEQVQFIERVHEALSSIENLADELSPMESRNATLMRATRVIDSGGVPQEHGLESPYAIASELEALKRRHREVLARLPSALGMLRSLLMPRGFEVHGELGAAGLHGLRDAVRASGVPVPRRRST